MSDSLNGLRCRPGDLAVIVQDEPECLANIGQVVRVLKPSLDFPDELGFHWEIQPLSGQPSPVVISSRANKDMNARWSTTSAPGPIWTPGYVLCWMRTSGMK